MPYPSDQNRLSLKPELIQLAGCAIQAAIKAGKIIENVYSSQNFQVQIKDDNTPVTLADRLAHEEILNCLEKTGLPVLSEEGAHLSYSKRKNWDLFWLVDPLDGTKEFIKRNDEFTVNIALIQQNQPIAGVIYVPVTHDLYAGIPEIGAYKMQHPDALCDFQSIQKFGLKLPYITINDEYVVATSRSHLNQETLKFLKDLEKKHQKIRIIYKGSSLKICMIAEGSAHLYPKIGTTMEWDTAAGHAIVKASGKNIFHTDLKTELSYNKENLKNPSFMVL